MLHLNHVPRRVRTKKCCVNQILSIQALAREELSCNNIKALTHSPTFMDKHFKIGKQDSPENRESAPSDIDGTDRVTDDLLKKLDALFVQNHPSEYTWQMPPTEKNRQEKIEIYLGNFVDRPAEKTPFKHIAYFLTKKAASHWREIEHAVYPERTDVPTQVVDEAAKRAIALLLNSYDPDKHGRHQKFIAIHKNFLIDETLKRTDRTTLWYPVSLADWACQIYAEKNKGRDFSKKKSAAFIQWIRGTYDLHRDGSYTWEPDYEDYVEFAVREKMHIVTCMAERHTDSEEEKCSMELTGALNLCQFMYKFDSTKAAETDLDASITVWLEEKWNAKRRE
jgi:hypothetical protein